MQKKILIVGASSGLGRRLCELYCHEGHIVGIVARRKDLLDEIQLKFPKQVSAFPFDISDQSCEENLKKCILEIGGIDLLIVTASIVDFNPSLLLKTEEELIGVNIKGFVTIINVAYHYFSEKGNGQIVGVTSIAAARGNKTTPAYNASKSFQSSYLESIRLKLINEKKNIWVTELIPGYIDTQMARGDRLFWVANINKAALQAKKAIEQRKARAFITKRWFLIYHLYKFTPSFIYNHLINSKFKLTAKS